MFDVSFIGEKFSSNYVYTDVCEFNDYIRLQKIQVVSLHRNKGYGTRTIEAIIDYANSKNKMLVLFALPNDKKWSSKKLKEFYKKFGFLDLKNSIYDFKFKYDNMYKLPQKN